MSWGEPIRTVNYLLSCLFFLTIHSATKWLRKLLLGKGRVWEISNGAEHLVLECHVLLARTRNHKNHICQSDPCIHTWFSYSRVLRAMGAFIHHSFDHSFITFTPQSSCRGGRTSDHFLCVYPSHSTSVVFLDIVVFDVLWCYPKL